MHALKINPLSKRPISDEFINLWVGSTAVGIVLVGKYWYTQADTDALLFLLQPISQLVHLISNQHYTFLPAEGYYFPNGNILISADCSGFNWLLLAYLIGIFAGLRFLKKPFYKIPLLPVLLLISYVLSLLVNSTRILFSIILMETLDQHSTWLHLAEGTFIYLSSLILWYLACLYFFNKINSQL